MAGALRLFFFHAYFISTFIGAQMVTITKTMVTIINKMTMVTIINKMTKSKWRFAQVHEKRYS